MKFDAADLCDGDERGIRLRCCRIASSLTGMTSRRIKRAPGRRLRYGRALIISERLSLTGLMFAPPAAQQKLNRYGLALDRQILKASVGRATPISGPPSAIRANAAVWPGSGNNPTIIICERNPPELFVPGPGDYFIFVGIPAIAASCLTASEPHKLRKTPFKCQATRVTSVATRKLPFFS